MPISQSISLGGRTQVRITQQSISVWRVCVITDNVIRRDRSVRSRKKALVLAHAWAKEVVTT